MPVGARGGGRPEVTAVMIVNPASDSGGTAKAWPGIAEGAKLHGIDADVRLTTAAPGTPPSSPARRSPGSPADRGGGWRRHISEVANGFFDGGGRSRRRRSWRWSAAARGATSSVPSASPRRPTALWTWPPGVPRHDRRGCRPLHRPRRPAGREAVRQHRQRRHDRHCRRAGQPVLQAAGRHRRPSPGRAELADRRLPQPPHARDHRRPGPRARSPTT